MLIEEGNGMKPRVLFVVSIMLFAALACNLPMAPSPGAVTPTGALDVLTLAAQTALARQTQPADTETAQATKPSQATATNPGPPTRTPVPPTDTPQPCDLAAFIQDVTIPDGTRMLPGQAFTKTWRLQNVGICSWNTSYALVFTGGDAMGAPAVVNLPGNVPPNGTVDLSIDMKAPASAGKFTGNWKLRNSTGGIFGISGPGPIFVQIQVVALTLTPTITPTRTITPTVTITPTATTPPSSGLIYNFAANLCKAEWRSQAGVLPCEGTEGDVRGSVLLLKNRALENGSIPSDPAALTVPDSTKTGAITGSFPAITIQPGYRFQAALGCVQGAAQCSVIYQVNYIVNNGQPSNLKEVKHTYNGSLQQIDIDLSSLAGQSIQIVLAVLADGSSEGDQAVWVFPRIVKP
jgi:hypothetical protein